MSSTASDFICQSLVEAGVRQVFGGHGGALVPLVNSVCKHPNLTWVCTRNETNASLMAAASAKLLNGEALGACISTSGPAASNLVTGLLDAQLDKVPLIAITGCKPRSDLGHSEFQDIDQSRLLASGGLAYSITVTDPTQLLSVMRDAIAIAFTQRACVHVAVPVDIQVAPIKIPTRCLASSPAEILQRVKGRRPHPAASLEQLANLLSSDTERVVFVIGLEAREAGKEILALAKLVDAPVVTRLDAKGSVDEMDANAIGVVGVHGKPGMATTAAVIDESSLIVAFGVPELSVLLCDLNGLQKRKLVEVATDSYGVCTRFEALYTFVADPAITASELSTLVVSSRSKRPGLMQQGSLLNTLSSLVSPSGEKTANDKQAHPSRWWHSIGAASDLRTEKAAKAVARAMRARRSARTGEPVSPVTPATPVSPGIKPMVRRDSPWIPLDKVAGDGYCHPGHLLMKLGPYLTEEDVICIDTGDITLWTALCLRLTNHSVTLSSERLGTMGYALCAGIAASLRRGPTARGVVIAGDGGFQMTLNELGTAMQHNARLIIIVMDNKVLGRVEFGFNNALGCGLTGPDWVALARAYGADGMALTDDSQVGDALERAFACTGVFVLAVSCDPEVKAHMATFKARGIVKVDSA